jgi:hypothetical protein
MHGAIPPLPQYVFVAWCLVEHRDNFTFCTFYLLPLTIFYINLRENVKLCYIYVKNDTICGIDSEIFCHETVYVIVF